MASKKSNPKKHYPVVRSAELSSTSENAILRFLQVDQELSKLNRRLYRMGRYYQTKIDLRPTGPGLFEVYALRDDWAVQKGFQMAYQAYMENTSEERAKMAKTQIARWSDFRVSPGVVGVQLVSKLHDPTGAGSLLTNGEFSLANVTDAAGADRQFTWSPSPGVAEYSILNEYDRAGDAQDSPDNFAAPGPYEGIDSDTNALTYDHLEQDGNQPPYDRNTVNQGTPWVRIATLGTTTNEAQRLSTGFFTAPCGIVLIVGSNPTWNSDLVTMTVKAGDYKGVHAPIMLE